MTPPMTPAQVDAYHAEMQRLRAERDRPKPTDFTVQHDGTVTPADWVRAEWAHVPEHIGHIGRAGRATVWVTPTGSGGQTPLGQDYAVNALIDAAWEGR